jgi:hypothetical protein
MMVLKLDIKIDGEKGDEFVSYICSSFNKNCFILFKYEDTIP